MFKEHHYLTGNHNNAARCYLAVWDDVVIGFASVITMPSGTVKNAWRGHRIVILPDFQGLGVGTKFGDIVAQIHIDQGHRFFTRTAHPKLGIYKQNSPLWKATSKNSKVRVDIKQDKVYNNYHYDNKRLCFSYEYIGEIKKDPI